MKFLCDEMLTGLGRWLRIAGYDTEYVVDEKRDEAILKYALEEKRLLLTRDAHFLEMKGGEKTVVYLRGNALDEWVKELKERLHLDWLYRPFSRCLLCNTLLEKVEQSEYWYCPECKKMYWEGSHTEQMLKQLKEWK